VVQQAQKKGAPNHNFRGSTVDGEREKFDKNELRIRYSPVAWGMPFDEIAYSKFFTVFLQHANLMPWDTIVTTESTYLPSARNEIHNMYLETDFPFLMMLDSDILFPPFIVERLMAHNLPIVGGWYKNKNRLKKYTPHPIVYDFINMNEDGVANFKHREYPGKGLEKVDGMGAGCWLMKKEVAQALGKSPYDMNKGGEDLRLSKRLMDLDIPLHVDWDIPLAHVGVSWV